jgi:thiol-disulfide isomerase/thioredoxin
MTDAAPSTSGSLGKFLLPLGGILVLVVGGLLLVKSQVKTSPPASGTPDIRVGARLPEIPLRAFGGGNTKLSELKSKVVLVNFWATWCEACMVEMPSIIKLRNQYHDKGFEVVPVNVDENPDAVLPRTIKRFGMNFTVYTDAEGKLGELFDIHAIPLTLILDQTGKILFIENGERDWNGTDIHTQLERWLSEFGGTTG